MLKDLNRRDGALRGGANKYDDRALIYVLEHGHYPGSAKETTDSGTDIEKEPDSKSKEIIRAVPHLASNSSSFVYDTLVVFGTCPALYSSGVRTSIKRGLFGEFLQISKK
eukprot:1159877-Pelagomonas_calceolata.AAC.22